LFYDDDDDEEEEGYDDTDNDCDDDYDDDGRDDDSDGDDDDSYIDDTTLGGEPLFTASTPAERNKVGAECMDYIFFSTGRLRVQSLLSLPLVTETHR